MLDDRPQLLQPARDDDQALCSSPTRRRTCCGKPHAEGRLRLQPATTSSTSSPATSPARTTSTASPTSTHGKRVAASCRRSPGPGTTGPTTHPDIAETASSSQDEWQRAAVAHAQRRPALRLAGHRAADGAEPRRAAARRRHRHERDPRGHEQLRAAPRLRLDAGARRPHGRARRLRHLLRPHAGDHDRHGALEQRHQRADHHVHRRLIPAYPNIYTALPTGARSRSRRSSCSTRTIENPEVHQASLGVERALTNDISRRRSPTSTCRATTCSARPTSTSARRRP